MEETKKIGWGGARKGAGRKKTKRPEELRNSHAMFNVSSATAKRIKYLRMFTAGDAVPFNRMFENWVKEEADKLGIKVE